MNRRVRRIVTLLVIGMVSLGGLLGNRAPVQASSGPVFNSENGHWYERVSSYGNWYAARNAAASRTHNGVQGYLATITSQQEQDFVRGVLAGGIAWLGGHQTPLKPCQGGNYKWANWHWIGGEPWGYTNWDSGQPDDRGWYESGWCDYHQENHLVMRGNGKWHDYNGDRNRLSYYIVEYESNNQAPIADAGVSYSGLEGLPLTFDASGSSDPDGDSLQFRWDFDGDGTWDTGWSANPEGTHSWSDQWSGTATVEVGDGTTTATATASVTVANAPPIAAITGAPTESSEGSEVTLGSAVTDPGPADAAAGFTLNWTVTKDGTPYAAGTGASLSFRPNDNGTYGVSLSATDKDSGVGMTTTNILVTNADPTVQAGEAVQISSGQVFNMLAIFADQGTADTHTAIVEWGDGSSAAGVVTEAEGAGIVAGSHQYFAPGDYAVTIRVADDDGGTGSNVRTVTVIPVPIAIDLKLESERNPVNPSGNGVVPVAVLTNDAIDAGTVDVATARFGVTGNEAAPDHSRGHLEDLDGDGRVDLGLHFRTGDLGIATDTPGDTTLVLRLTARLTNGIYVQGEDAVWLRGNARAGGKGDK